jgi:excisionase family DNA binding protein
MSEENLIKRLFTVREAAAYLSIAQTTLYHWVARREVPVVRLRRKAVRFDRQDLDRLIEKVKLKTTQEAANNGTLQARQEMVDRILPEREDGLQTDAL